MYCVDTAGLRIPADKETAMKKETITIAGQNSPAPVSPATKAGGFIFISGQCGYDMREGRFFGDDIESQVRGALDNLCEVLEAAGSDLDHVLRTSIFLKNVEDFAVVNSIYKEYFTGEKPARTCLQIAKIPLDALVEIEAVAIEK